MTNAKRAIGKPSDDRKKRCPEYLNIDTPDPAPGPVCGEPPYAEEIIGEKYSLRRLHAHTVSEDYLKWLNDPEVIRFLQVRFEKRDEANAKRFLESFDHVNSFIFGIYAKDIYLGNITLRANPNHLFANMGYLIGEKKFWRTDAATEAVRMVCDFAFFERGLRKIFELTTENHIASNFNFRRLGFSYEGKIPDLYWGEGKYHAATIWTMSALQWAELRDVPVENVTP